MAKYFLCLSFYLFFGSGLLSQNFQSQGDCDKRYDDLTSQRMQQKAIEIFENAKKNKKRKNKKAYHNKINESARLGYIPAKILLLKKALQESSEWGHRNKVLLEQSTDCLLSNNCQLKIDNSALLMQNFAHEEAEAEIYFALLDLEELQSKGEKFSYDWDFIRENNLYGFLFKDYDVETQIKAKKIKTVEEFKKEASSFFNVAQSEETFLQFFLNNLNDLINKSSHQEALNFLHEIFALTEASTYKENVLQLEKYEKSILNILKLKKVKPESKEKLENFVEHCQYFSRELDDSFSTLEGKIYGEIKKYCRASYLGTMASWTELAKAKEAVISLCSERSNNTWQGEPVDGVFNLVDFYVKAHDLLPFSENVLKQKALLAQEAQKYVDLLNQNPLELLERLAPGYHKLIAAKPNASERARELLNNSVCYGEPEFSIRFSHISDCIKTRVAKYQLYYLNKNQPSTKELLLRDNFLTVLSQFVDFSKLAFLKFKNQSLKQNINELFKSNVFRCYDGYSRKACAEDLAIKDGYQQIWTHKKLPFSIRIHNKGGNYNIKTCFLKQVPYDNQGRLIITKSGDFSELISQRENELFKFSPEQDFGFVIPASLKPGDWLGYQPQKALMDKAHIEI